MATQVLRWIADNGDVLTPLSASTYNDSAMISSKGVYYFAITQETGGATEGTPMGLLLAITYAT